MLDLPELDGWTLDTVAVLVREGVFESESFDFKEMLPHPKSDAHKTRLRKAIAAFANSDGGFFVFGVKDDRDIDHTDRIVGLDATIDLPEHFGSYPSTCRPSVRWDFKNPPIGVTTGRLVHVVYIPPSLLAPHAVDIDDGFVFPKRTNKGTEPMSIEEVRGAFRYTEFRRSKLALVVAELEHIRSLAVEIKRHIDAWRGLGDERFRRALQAAWATRYPTMLLDSALADAHGFIDGDVKLWGALQQIRTVAVRHNAVCEGFANIAYTNMSNRRGIDEDHYGWVEEDANSLIGHATAAIDFLDVHLRSVPTIRRRGAGTRPSGV